MKILELDLRAYGPFTDRQLDLSGGEQGLHLIFGPNEAGKSSALRALRALLFGVPERTRDDFRHDKQDLRLGGRLRGRGGEELTLVRRKGRKSTLLDPEGQALAEDVLAPFIGEVDQRLFERLFGIDYEALISGGQTLLEERGREAEALFGAALGATAIRRLLDELELEANALFLPRASKPHINSLLSRHAESERRLREASLPARDWEQARQSLDQLTRELSELETEIEHETRERGRLERIRRTLPELARLDRLHERLSALGELPVLPADVATRRADALTQRISAVETTANAGRRLAALDTEIQAESARWSEALLSEAATIEAWREQLGSHRKAARDRAQLEIEQRRHTAAAAALLSQARPEWVEACPGGRLEPLRPLLRRRRRVTELGEQRAALLAGLARTRADLAEAEDRHRAAASALAGLAPPVSSVALERALTEARRVGDLDQALAESEQAWASQLADCERELQTLGLWSGDLAALRRLPMPAEESLRSREASWRELAERRQGIMRRREESCSELASCEETLRRLQLVAVVPTEQDLGRAREQRNQGWQLVRRAWRAGADPGEPAPDFSDGVGLADAFELAMGRSDEIADRLRHEAERVQERAAAQSRLERMQQQIAVCDQELADHDRALTEWQDDWRALWGPAGLVPLMPGEMLPWLAQSLRLREKVAHADELRARGEALESQRATHRARLLAVLTETGAEPAPSALDSPTLSALILRAESRSSALAEAAHKRLALEKEVAELAERIQRLVRERAAAEAALADWQTAWTALTAELGLDPDATPGAVADDLQTLAEALKEDELAVGLAARIAGIDRDAVVFVERIRDGCSRLAPELQERPPEEAVEMLHGRLVEQRERATRHQALCDQAARATEEQRAAETAVAAAEQVLAELCRQAGCVSPDELPAIEERVRERRRLGEQLAEVELGLIRAGDGRGIARLREEADGVDQDEILARLEALDRRLEQVLRPAHRQLIARQADLAQNLKTMSHEGAAGAIAEEGQQILAEIRARAERYVRVKLAARLLRDEIERFRRQHSDPILKQTSHYFAALTRGAFSAVETDFDDTDQPVLIGRRSNGERLRVEAMSTGTRDQLYLALRLANLEQYLRTNEPLPFIVDDILIQFDDDRALATLETLAAFSAKTQVILFTHHGRDLEQARQLDPDGQRVWIHRL